MKTDEIEKTEKTASGDYLRMMTCYVIWGFQPLYFHLKPDIDGLFLLMSRILWGCVLVTAVVLLRGRGREILETFRDKELMLKHLIPGAFFNFLDLALYLFAVTSGHILATSLGYYVAPLVVCALGVVVFHEKLTWQLIAAAALILTGVLLSGSGFGNAPLISIGLMFCFSIYAAFMKGVKKDAVVCTAVHLMLVAPFALLTIRVGGFRHADFSHGCRGGHVPADRAVRELREAGPDGRHGTFAVPVADLRHCLQHHPARKNGARTIHHHLLHLGGTASVYRRDNVPGAAGKAGRNTDGCRSGQ